VISRLSVYFLFLPTRGVAPLLLFLERECRFFGGLFIDAMRLGGWLLGL
jgi:hypothetical protein